MHDSHPKFIIEAGYLIIGKVSFHKELAINKEKLQGGGWFSYDHENKTFFLYGESVDFGRASLEDIKLAVNEHKVFSHYSSSPERSLTHKYKFIYRDDSNNEITEL